MEGDCLGIIWGVVILGVVVENFFLFFEERIISGLLGFDFIVF